MRVRMTWLVLLAAAWTAPVAAQDQPAEGPTVDILAAAVAHEDRRLLTGCQPVYLDLELEDNKRSTDLTVDRIRTMAESRLRASRLLADEHSDVTLDVSVWVIDPAFYGNVSLTQPVYLSLGNTCPIPYCDFSTSHQVRSNYPVLFTTPPLGTTTASARTAAMGPHPASTVR